MSHTNKGSLTIEAAIVLPIFLFIMLGILSLINLVIANELIDKSMSESAKLLSSYAYILDITGIKEKHDEKIGEIQDGKEQSEIAIEKVKNVDDKISTITKSMESVVDNIKKLDDKVFINEKDKNFIEVLKSIPEYFKAIKETILVANENIDNTVESVLELEKVFSSVAENPTVFMKSVLYMMSDNVINHGKGKALGLLTSAYIKLYYGDKGDRLEQLGIVKGVKGLNFDNSTFFSYENNAQEGLEDIDMIVTYEFKSKIPIASNFIFKIKQRKVLRAWID